MKNQYNELDLLTQQFVIHRWHTKTGSKVRERILEAFDKGKEISGILNEYILKHPANVESYEYPYYPPDAIIAEEFWVLADDDLRGIQFIEKDFSNTPSFVNLNLSYSQFTQCNFRNINFDFINLTRATCIDCDFSSSVIKNTAAQDAKFTHCKFHSAAIINSAFKDCDFSAARFSLTYFESVKLRRMEVDYLTHFDKTLRRNWHDRRNNDIQLPDIYRSIRQAYENEEMNTRTDFYLNRERIAHREFMLWDLMLKHRNLKFAYIWFRDLIWSIISGYGTRPSRTIITGVIISIIYAMLFYAVGAPVEPDHSQTDIYSSLYFSFTTFATLGYGDLSYRSIHPIMRLISTSEAWVGHVMISLFVVVVARKIIRR